MTVTAFRLSNFMPFGEPEGDSGWIDLRPITLLYGKNSSGKSSVLRALRLLKQSLEQGSADLVFAYSQTHGVDVGTFLTMAHHSNLIVEKEYQYREDDPYWVDKRAVGFSFRCQLPTLDLRDFLFGDEIEIEYHEIILHLRYGWMVEKDKAALIGFSLHLLPAFQTEQRLILEAIRLPGGTQPSDDGIWEYASHPNYQEEELAPDEGNVWSFVEVITQFGFLPRLAMKGIADAWQSWVMSEEVNQVNRLLEHINDIIAGFLRQIQYIAPIRPAPQRVYVFDAEGEKRLRDQGLGKYLDYLQGNLTQGELELLQREFKKLKLGLSNPRAYPASGVPPGVTVSQVTIDVTMPDPEDEEVEQVIFEQVNLADLGFGISQVLPVLIHSVLADQDSLVLIEQPELHLHPEAQANLADIFANIIHRVATDTDGRIQKELRPIRFLIETHSEYLMLRFRRLISQTTYAYIRAREEEKLPKPIPDEGDKSAARRKEPLPPLEYREFILVFVQLESGTSSTESVQVDHQGQLISSSHAFGEFFDRDYREVVALTELRSAIIAFETEDEGRH